MKREKRLRLVLQKRLSSWQREQQTNQHGLKYMAPKVIRAIEYELHELEMQRAS